MKKIYLIILGLIILGSLVSLAIYYGGLETENQNGPVGQCGTNEMIFYYLDTCGWCQKVKNEGTISKIEELGVEVTQINAKVGPIQHQFRGVPTFVINDKVYSGYRTFEQLKELLSC